MALEEAKTSRPGPPPLTFSGWRKFRSAVNVGAIFVLSFYILVVFNLILYRHPRRIDFTTEGIHTLSDETRKHLELVPQEIRVVMPYFFQHDNSLHKIQRQLFFRARELLKEYIHVQPKIKIEGDLNLLRHSDAVRWSEIRSRYDLAENLINRFIFLTRGSGDGAEGGYYRQVVTLDDLATYDRPVSRVDPSPPRIHEFRGERGFTDALTRLIRREKRKVYLTTDWGELSVDDEREGGLSRMKTELESSGYEVKTCSLLREASIPSDCDILLMASPSKPVEESARDKIHDYLLRREGRLWVTLGQSVTGIETLLGDWGIDCPSGVVWQKQVLGNMAWWRDTVFATEYNRFHPITAEFPPNAFEVMGYRARPVVPQKKDDFTAEYLFRAGTEPECFLDRNGNKKPDAGERGRVPLACAAWREPPGRLPPNYQPFRARIAVFGNGSPLTNDFFEKFSHRDLTLNTVRWLVGREEEVGVSGKPWGTNPLRWSPGIQQFLFWVPIFVLPGIVLCFGVFVYFLRRR